LSLLELSGQKPFVVSYQVLLVLLLLLFNNNIHSQFFFLKYLSSWFSFLQ